MNKRYILQLMLLLSGSMMPYQGFAAAEAHLESKSSAGFYQQVKKGQLFAFQGDRSQPVLFGQELIGLSGLFSAALEGSNPEEIVFLEKNSLWQGFPLRYIHKMLLNTHTKSLSDYYRLKEMPELLKIAQLANYIGCEELFNKTIQEIAKKFVALGNINNPGSIRSYLGILPLDIERAISAEIIGLCPSHFFSDPNFIKTRIRGNYARIVSAEDKKLKGHNRTVWGVSWNHQGTKLASASGDNTVRIWDVAKQTCEKVLVDHTNSVCSVSWNGAGTKLASASADNMIHIWNVNTGYCDKVLAGHTSHIWSVSWNPQDTKLASASADNTVCIWDVGDVDDVNRGNCEKILAHAGPVSSVSWNPQGTKLASASDDNKVRIWDVATANCDKVLTRHTDKVLSVSWNPQSTKLASASQDKTICIWDGVTGICEKVLTGHDDRVLSVSWNPHGTRLASTSNDKTIRIWNEATGKCEQVLTASAYIALSVSWNFDGTKIASGLYNSGVVRIWDIGTRDSKIKKMNSKTFAQLIALDPQVEPAYQEAQRKRNVWFSRGLKGLCLAAVAYVGFKIFKGYIQ